MKFTTKGVVSDDTIEEDGTAAGSRGGTEMMKERLLSSMTDEENDTFNIICSRVRKVDPDKRNILWLHDTYDDPESHHLADPESRKRFDKMVFVSEYQWQTYHMAYGIGWDEAVVIPNAIEPIEMMDQENLKENDGPLKLIYHTTPHRGLELLVPVFEHLYEKGMDIELDVFSSFNIYGWDERDKPYEALFERCREHPGINYHGTQPNEVVRAALKKAHIFAYPNIWPETSCLAAIEAMSAGCQILCPNYAALPETTAGFAVKYQWTPNHNTHASIHAHILRGVIENYWNESNGRRLVMQKTYADNFYDWSNNRVHNWKALFAAFKPMGEQPQSHQSS